MKTLLPIADFTASVIVKEGQMFVWSAGTPSGKLAAPSPSSQGLGYTVVEAGSAEEALKLVDRGLQPDVLVTDHLMPGMSGTELARILQSTWPSTKVLIVSGYAEAEGVAPDLPRLAKPFRSADLAKSLAAWFEACCLPFWRTRFRRPTDLLLEE